MVYNSQFAGCSGVGYGRVGDRSQLTTPSPPAHCQPIRIKPSRGVGSVICTLTLLSLSPSLSLHLSLSSSLCSLHITLIFGVATKIPTVQQGALLLLTLFPIRYHHPPSRVQCCTTVFLDEEDLDRGATQ